MRSTLLTVSLEVMMTPAFSRAGRPFGNASSITRYSLSSALTNGATHVFLLVTTGSSPSSPSAFRIASTEASGLGVILSIMDQGKLTLAGSSIYAANPASARPFSTHFFANALTAA